MEWVTEMSSSATDNMSAHGELVARVEVYEDGYTIFETKKEKQEGVTSAMQDMILAMFFLLKGALDR